MAGPLSAQQDEPELPDQVQPPELADPLTGGITVEVLPAEEFNFEPIITQAPIRLATTSPDGAVLRALDKISGEVVDFDLSPDQTKQLGRIQVSLGECRYPSENPASDAAALLIIRNVGDGLEVFTGWMLASSPALNGLDHPRYDVWVLRCITP
ncbi:MAG: DUF2155 domain-containing protein [Paracoccaceae bacterium]